MQVELTDTICTVTREPGDPVFRGALNAAGESRLLYHVKRVLNERGHDLIKKRMHKDGHMVSEMQQYLRSRVLRPGRPCLAIWNTHWQIEGADDILRRDGVVTLCVEDIGKGAPDVQ